MMVIITTLGDNIHTYVEEDDLILQENYNKNAYVCNCKCQSESAVITGIQIR